MINCLWKWITSLFINHSIWLLNSSKIFVTNIQVIAHGSPSPRWAGHTDVHSLVHGNHKKLVLGEAMRGESSEEGLAHITSTLGRGSNLDHLQVILSPSTVPAAQHKTLVAKAYTSHSPPHHVHLHFTSHVHIHITYAFTSLHETFSVAFSIIFSHHNHHYHHWSYFSAER